jgi:threonine aldolase
LYALDHNIERMAEDHGNALIAGRLQENPNVVLDFASVQTNIIVFGLRPGGPDAATVVNRARERGVLLFGFGPRTIRAVTHLDVSREQCEQAAAILVEVIVGR